jgi:hypothetical protein
MTIVALIISPIIIGDLIRVNELVFVAVNDELVDDLATAVTCQ